MVGWSQLYPPVSNQIHNTGIFQPKITSLIDTTMPKMILAAILNTKMPSMSSYQSIELLILKTNDKQALKLS